MTTENGHNADGAESSEVAISDLEQKIIRQVEVSCCFDVECVRVRAVKRWNQRN